MKVTHVAEQATLGALLLHPAAARDVAGWLRSGDFAHPWHEAVYRVIQEHHAAGRAIDPQQVGADLMQWVGPQRADLPRVVDLLRITPTPANAAVYGRMVLEASLRREVAGQGVLLRGAALAASLAGRRGPVTTVTGMVDAILDAASHRWSAATSDDPVAVRAHPVMPLPIRAPQRNLHARLDADRFLSAHPPLDEAAVRDHEAHLVASLVTHPSQIAATVTWLRAEALTNRIWRPVYSALVQLNDDGRPVDPLTLAWEVQRASFRCGRGPEYRDLHKTVDGATASDPVYLGRVVAADHLRRAADHAADGLARSAANPGVDVRDLLGTGHLFAAALREASLPLPDDAMVTAPRPHLAVARDLSPAAGRHMDGPVAG